jgi:outer membrane protein assembly factor BamB
MLRFHPQFCGRVAFGLAILGLALSISSKVLGDDWPHWNGPTRTGAYAESGTIRSIPEGGLKKLWSAPVSLGYSGPAVVGGRVYVSDYVKTSGEILNNPSVRVNLSGSERIRCLDATTGNEVWAAPYECAYSLSYPSGPRATPTVDGSNVYSLGAEGDLLCLDANSGKVIWERRLKEDYHTQSPIWGYSAAPVIHGGLLYVLAGGEGSLIVALDKLTGQERWRALSGSDIGYCPPTLIRAANQDQLVVWEPKAVHGLDPLKGESLWSYPLAPKYEMSIIPPVILGDRMYLCGIGDVAAMLQLDSAQPGVKELWQGKPKRAIYAGNSTPVADGEYLYGADCQQGTLICARASDGERMWETYAATGGGNRRLAHGTCFLNKVGDLYYILSETGDFIIAKLTPEKYEEIGRFHVVDPTNECFDRAVVWSYPAYANRCLYVRNDKELACYSIEDATR